jgi:hypothetical protein
MASLAVMCFCLAVMSGHFLSIDGLGMWRQALALTYHHSWSLVPPIWWGSAVTSSSRGVGASLEYVPSLVIFSWLAGHVPVQAGQQYDFKLIYSDLLYTVAGAPVWVAITAATAYVVGLTTKLLGGDSRAALWAIAFYGLGSPALAASRGDWPQPLVAICWALSVYASLKYGSSGGRRWLWISAAGVFYGVLARPLEGSLVLPGVLLILWAGSRKHPIILAGQVGAWLAAVAATLLTNWARFGSPTNFGYPGSISWSTPIWIGFPGDLLSPGRGLLWEFPALVLAALGATLIWRSGRRIEAMALAGVPAVLFLEACQFFDWAGGWDWGFRFFVPALPIVAALAGLGAKALPPKLNGWLPGALLAGGFIWNIPAVTTDLLAGYGQTYATTAANWRLDAYPPIGAWRFVNEIFPTAGAGGSPIDIVWFRATRVVGKVSLIPFLVLLAASGVLWTAAVRQVGKPREAC